MSESHFINKLNQITLAKFIRWSIRLLIFLFIILFILFAWFILWPVSSIPDAEPVDKYVYLEQGWGGEAESEGRNIYYYTPQGTTMAQGTQHAAVRYNWFVNLELPFSEEKFSSPEHMRKYRFIVEPEPTAKNPHQLPVGFTKHFNSSIGQDVLDITCAACHSGEIHYTREGTKFAIRIDGGQAMHAFTDPQRGNFAPVLLASMLYTRLNPWKFDRFAQGVLGDSYPSGKDKLKAELWTSIKGFLDAGQNNPFRHLYPVQEGFGRTDALGRIGNTVFGDHLTSDNYQDGAAPVSYPYVWNIWKFDWVQYNGSVAQPLARNIGEALGVGAVIPLLDDNGNPLPAEQRFISSVRVEDLTKIEHNLQKLTPPPWPESILGKVDQQKAVKGKALFNQYCQQCHGPHPATLAKQQASAPLKLSPLDEWLIEVVPTDHIGTDPTAADGFMDRRYDISSTGITNEDVIKTLNPLLLRQLNRNVEYRLKEVIRLREELHLDAEELKQALTNFPSPNSEETPTYPKAAYQNILSVLSSISDLEPGVDQVTTQPDTSYSCRVKCQTENLIWLLKSGYETYMSIPKSWDVTSLTEGEGLSIIGLLIKNKYYQDKKLDYAQIMQLQGFGTIDLPQQIRGYKPRPLAGVWATPPFLHNGSVPSVYEMLLPPEQRTKSFYMGSREYDPQNLGFVVKTEENSDGKGFLFDTSVKGNWNIGHAFVADSVLWTKHQTDYKNNPLPKGVIGPLLTDEERYAIIEYLKIKKDEYACYQTDERGNCTQGEWN
ncbi:di-heme-cytochrome C peroxidase [Aliikangiella sp. G2MR2-5]|uniref:di-heme-cytochrome C peroxidase n=1 Tax=Aliikangiella sp. G2MR2-5 TaxID=2788943 RepID=UPI0018A9C99D|nr:di-heme-cytochrome C peroxidase [Aliikangiella sp. G2MR2-5]